MERIAARVRPFIRPWMRRWYWLLRMTLDAYNADNGSRAAAALAFFSVFSLAPLLIIAVAVAGLFVGRETAMQEIYQQVLQSAGKDVADFVLRTIQSVRQPRTNLIVTLVGLGSLIWGASGIFNQLRESMNQIWKIPGPQGLDVLTYLRRYALSILMVFVMGALLFVSIMLSTTVAVVTDRLAGDSIRLGWLTQFANFVVMFFVTALLFSAIYRTVPDRPIPWRDAWTGSLVTASLFSIGRYLIALYLARVTPGSAFGAAGTLLVILLWVQYSAQIFLFGAEFTYVWSNYRSRRASAYRRLGDESGEDPASSPPKRPFVRRWALWGSPDAGASPQRSEEARPELPLR
jgi:membrane protein